MRCNFTPRIGERSFDATCKQESGKLYVYCYRQTHIVSLLSKDVSVYRDGDSIVYHDTANGRRIELDINYSLPIEKDEHDCLTFSFEPDGIQCYH